MTRERDRQEDGPFITVGGTLGAEDIDRFTCQEVDCGNLGNILRFRPDAPTLTKRRPIGGTR